VGDEVVVRGCMVGAGVPTPAGDAVAEAGVWEVVSGAGDDAVLPGIVAWAEVTMPVGGAVAVAGACGVVVHGFVAGTDLSTSAGDAVAEARVVMPAPPEVTVGR
jgi:hypothetical protein